MNFCVKLSFIAIVVILLQEGECLRCYQCNSALKGYCDDPLNAKKASIETCASDQHSCAHLSVTIDGKTEIRRECADVSYCHRNSRIIRQASSFSRSCSTCSGDLCNSSKHYVPSFPIGFAGFLFSKFLF